jgi:hypothetical protein
VLILAVTVQNAFQSRIGQLHNVTPAELVRARGRIDSKGLDLPVNLPMTVLFL